MEALKKLQFWIDLDSKSRQIGVFQNYLAIWTVYLTETLVPRLENHSSFLQRRTKPRDIQIVISSNKSVKKSIEINTALIFH